MRWGADLPGPHPTVNAVRATSRLEVPTGRASLKEPVSRRPALPLLFLSAAALLCAVARPVYAEVGVGGGGGVSYHSFFEGWGREPYPLDPVPRFLEPPARLRCDAGQMIRHRSRALRYAVLTNPAFVERLERFEHFVIEQATRHYGRAPRRLVHKGSFACRSARARRMRISEHALGNALDFQGLDFPPLARRVEAPESMPRHMRRGFALRVFRHWSPRRSRDDYHARFLHGLTEALRERPDIFRGIVGPPRPRHLDHLHLDAAPWRYAMFGYDTPEDRAR